MNRGAYEATGKAAIVIDTLCIEDSSVIAIPELVVRIARGGAYINQLYRDALTKCLLTLVGKL